MNRIAIDMPDGTCVVCCRDSVRIFAVGECDHPVCYECATRMRVLGAQNECAICRTQLPKVILVKERKPYAAIADVRYPLSDRKYQLYFEDENIQDACYRLLEHRCILCRIRPSYATFGQLRDHMRREHERHYCDLCVENLTVFTHERKSYNRADLARHRRIGDVDDTSHRGHPLCEFCDERYVDNDELFRHLRREHFYCHFCDADGLHHYYSDYKYLREHFRVEHFQCDDEACREERFTTAFRTEIDLKAHRAAMHNRNLTKAQAKQARTLELEFTITPRVPGGAATSGSSSAHASGTGGDIYVQDGDVASHHRKNRRGDLGSHKENGAASLSSRSGKNTSERDPFNVTFTGQHNVVRELPTPEIDLNSEQFPMLGENSVMNTHGADPASSSRNPMRDTMARKLAKLNRFTIGSSSGGDNDDGLGDTEFPALGPTFGQSSSSTSSPASFVARPQTSWTSSGNVQVKTSSNHVIPAANAAKKTLTVKLNSKDDFPGLVTTYKPMGSKPSLSLQVSRTVIPHSPNGTTSTASNSSKRQGHLSQPVITRMTSSQNITFLNNPATMREKQKASKDHLEKTAGSEGWVVLKKGERNAVQKRAMGSNNVSNVRANHDEDFPALETKKNKDSVAKMDLTMKNKEKKHKSLTATADLHTDKKNRLQKAEEQASTDDVENDGKMKMIENEENEFPGCEFASPLGTMDTGFNGMSEVDFPDLKSRSLKIQKTSPSAIRSPFHPPPGFGKLKSQQTAGPPPGFLSQTLNPPPGFSPSITSASNPTSDATFTNSNGQKYTFSTTISTVKPHEYLQPDGFHMRNNKLMERLADVLKNKDKVSTFRLLSGYFRKGEIAAAEYYAECIDVLGQDEFSRIFPELLVLLPDIQKQQMLLAFHKASQKQLQSDNNKNKHDLTASTAAATPQQILVCATCQQVLSVKDFRSHMDHHSLDDDFPSLGGSASSSLVQSKKASWVEKNKNIN